MIDDITKRNLLHLLMNDRNCKIGLEIGVNHGAYSEYLLENSNLDILYSVDVWMNEDGQMNKSFYSGEKAIANCVNKLAKFKERSVMIRGESCFVSTMFPNSYFDFIYIDACHEYEYVKRDLESWWPKLKDGGIFAGHDYSRRRNLRGVIKAVNEFIANKGLEIKLTDESHSSWIIRN